MPKIKIVEDIQIFSGIRIKPTQRDYFTSNAQIVLTSNKGSSEGMVQGDSLIKIDQGIYWWNNIFRSCGTILPQMYKPVH